METATTHTINWSAIQIEPADNSTCEACGMPGYALRKMPGWTMSQHETYPFLGAEGQCAKCHEIWPLYAPDRYTDVPLCGECYGKAHAQQPLDLTVVPAV